MDQDQETDDLSSGSATLAAEDDSRMSNAVVIEHEIIFVIGVNDALVGQSKNDMVNIIGADQSRLGSCCHVDSPALQTSGDGRRDMFIVMEPDLGRHAGPPAFLGAWKDTSASCQ